MLTYVRIRRDVLRVLVLLWLARWRYIRVHKTAASAWSCVSSDSRTTLASSCCMTSAALLCTWLRRSSERPGRPISLSLTFLPSSQRRCYANDTRSRNLRQKPAPENWRRFLAPVFHASCKISGARNQHGRIKSNQTFYLAVRRTHVK